jgi:crossover junction endodeoxyribonuclease RuvC
MKTLGIDPGFGRMGYAVLEKKNQKEKLICADCIETNPNPKHEERLLEIGKGFEKIIKKHKPQAIAIEKLFFAKNQKTALKVSESRGVILYISNLHNIPVYEFAPTEIKMALCGYGHADKKQVRKMLKIILNLKDLPRLDDASDAIAIALTHLSRTYPQ